jgi:hypothetical protein
MKLLQPENKDYAGYIVRLPSPVALEGLDNLVGLQVLGSQALVAKDTEYGELALVFTAGTQLSEEFAYENNLHRHSDKNKDQDKTGYLEDNRHVRALKLRGHSSSALVLHLDSLSYIKKLDLSQFNEGDTFDRIGDYEICKKYVSKKTYKERQLEKNAKIYSRVDGKFFPKHYDTDNYFKNMHIIPEEMEVTVTQKLHGTSIRIAHTIVDRPFKFVDKMAKFVGAKIQDSEYDYIYGSRNAVKDATNPRHVHFYDSDIWSIKGQELHGLIPMGYLVFGELIGWTPEGAALQSKYTYQVPEKCAELYVYRVATINPEGVVHDLTYDQVVGFCKERGIKVVPLLWRGKYKDFKPEDWVDFPGHPEMHNYKEDGYPMAVPLAKDSPCDEGVVIRAESTGSSPYTLKCKSETFVRHDNKVAEEGTLDMEEEGKIDA